MRIYFILLCFTFSNAEIFSYGSKTCKNYRNSDWKAIIFNAKYIEPIDIYSCFKNDISFASYVELMSSFPSLESIKLQPISSDLICKNYTKWLKVEREPFLLKLDIGTFLINYEISKIRSEYLSKLGPKCTIKENFSSQKNEMFFCSENVLNKLEEMKLAKSINYIWFNDLLAMPPNQSEKCKKLEKKIGEVLSDSLTTMNTSMNSTDFFFYNVLHKNRINWLNKKSTKPFPFENFSRISIKLKDEKSMERCLKAESTFKIVNICNKIKKFKLIDSDTIKLERYFKF